VFDQSTTRIVLFNLYSGGHHPQFLECLRAYWEMKRPEAELHVVVSDRHAQTHAESVARIEATPNTKLHVAQLPSNFEEMKYGTIARDRLHGRLAAHYARLLRPDQFMLMFFDHAQLSLAFNLRFSWPVAISGIYFRPSFHYGSLGGPPQTSAEKIKGLMKQLVLRGALRNPHLRTIFSLDPFVVPHIARWSRHTEPVALPEPLDHRHAPFDSSLLAGIEPGRRRLIIFGSLDAKKGIAVVLEALRALPPASQRKLVLILGGRVAELGRAELLTRIANVEAQTEVHVRLEDRFLPESEIQPLLASCDLVLLTYQRLHVGSSGVLVRAAAAGVPVLATDYGVVGEHVRRHRLGITVDATESDSIRAALEAWLERPQAIPFDARTAAAFARENTAEAYAETIFSRLLRSEGNRALAKH
jgi:glycosyltransferase involved in cell wall biosynthesis